ncbi:DUF4870 domain-containing protein [Colwellia echini]|uniref:DUF4870 domain-containing protein n=1 Tax=Colwellia echini TaxID=1982103 RepID=A0ABY3MTU6_9GAMM|nr:hypothetical protein [Colwellia echini]TYK64554.1 hypothetical protein CWS31_014980 [Colwellia echini]
MPHIPQDYENVFDKELTLVEPSKIAVLVAVTSYFTLVGWIIAMLANDKYKSDLARFHLRQSIGLIITGAILSLIPLIGWLLNIAIIIAWVTGLYYAIQGQEHKVPLVGDFYQKHLDFIE